MDSNTPTKYTYELKNFAEAEHTSNQTVVFYEKFDDHIQDGTTLEEMLRVSIERLKDLNSRFGCRENSLAITKMEESLMWLNKRTEDRVTRGVEGKHVA